MLGTNHIYHQQANVSHPYFLVQPALTEPSWFESLSRKTANKYELRTPPCHIPLVTVQGMRSSYHISLAWFDAYTNSSAV